MNLDGSFKSMSFACISENFHVLLGVIGFSSLNFSFFLFSPKISWIH